MTLCTPRSPRRLLTLPQSLPHVSSALGREPLGSATRLAPLRPCSARTARTLCLRPVRLSASGASCSFLPRPESSSFHAAFFQRRGGNTPPVPSRHPSSPIYAWLRALPRHDWHGCHSLLPTHEKRDAVRGQSCTQSPSLHCHTNAIVHERRPLGLYSA